MSKSNNFVVYEGTDEVIVCTPESEAKVLREWFDWCKRNPEDYNRTEVLDVVGFTFNPRMMT